MDPRFSTRDLNTGRTLEAPQAVLAEVTCSWGEGAEATEAATAVIVHAGRDILVLEAADHGRLLPPVGTALRVVGSTLQVYGRMAEHGRGGRFLVSLGNRPVRGDVRLRVGLSGRLRSPILPQVAEVEIADLTTSGARVRGVDLPVGSQVALDFTPPGRDEPVTVRARVTHTSSPPEQAWVGLVFRLVAMRGGR